MRKNSIKPADAAGATEHLDRIKMMIRKFESWFNSLDEDTQTTLRDTYEHAMNDLDDARADISAVTSEYLVCIAAAAAKEKEEGR